MIDFHCLVEASTARNLAGTDAVRDIATVAPIGDDRGRVPTGARKKASLKRLRPLSKDRFSSSGPAMRKHPGPGPYPAQEDSGRALTSYPL